MNAVKAVPIGAAHPSCQYHQQQWAQPAHWCNQKHLNYRHKRLIVSVNSNRRDLLAAVLSLPASCMVADTAVATTAAAPERDPMFYATWQYATPADVLPFIKQQAAPGDAQAVLDAMDTFSLYYP